MYKQNVQNNNKAPSFPRKKIYFEKQSNDRLCGLHCLNNLLQGPYFDMVMLSEIGLQLDEEEFKLTGFRAQNNVDDSGNYNVQVLERALKLYGAEIKSLRQKEAIKMLQQNDSYEALIFNSSTHWFSIRKIDGVWFNLNSTNAFPGPEIISDFYLSAFIQGTEDFGYTNFLVTNLPNLLNINSEQYSHLEKHQFLVDFDDIIKAKEEVQSRKKEQEEERKRKDEEERKKFKPFSGQGMLVDDTYGYFNGIYQGNNIYNHYEQEDYVDNEMQLAMKLSLQEFAEKIVKELPPEPQVGGYELRINFENKTFSRRFNDNDTIGTVVKYVQSQIPTMQHIQLFEPFPRLYLK